MEIRNTEAELQRFRLRAVVMGGVVLVALFAGVVINIGLEGWFSDRVREVVGNAQSAAVAYQEEHRADLTEDAATIAAVLRQAASANPARCSS